MEKEYKSIISFQIAPKSICWIVWLLTKTIFFYTVWSV